MPLTIGNPRDLALAQLGELLWIERTLAGDMIPTLLGEVKDPEFVEALREHLEQTKEHAVNVERALRALDSEASANASPPLEGLRREHELLASNIKADDLRDLF